MPRFVSRRPLVFSLLAVFLAVGTIKLLDIGLTSLKLSDLSSRLIVETVFCGYVGWLLTRLQWWRAAGFKQPESWRKLWAFLPLLFLPALETVVIRFQATTASRIFLFALLTLMVGFAEEGLLRGVLLQAMLPGGVTRAVWLSSLFFGMAHLFNLAQGASLSATLVQVIYATLLGIAFAGTRLYTGCIWPAILAHALIDFVGFASQGFVIAPLHGDVTLVQALFIIGLTGLYALYGGWLVRRAGLVVEGGAAVAEG